MLILSMVPFFLFHTKHYEMAVFSTVLISIQNSLNCPRKKRVSLNILLLPKKYFYLNLKVFEVTITKYLQVNLQLLC